jgi:MerR family transcriptional regulator, light-induced transcriptional regulator
MNMYQFSIRDIENLTGIKAHTLRIWEHRYGLVLCKRKESKHRFYDAEDLKRLLRIAYLYNHGHKISRIAVLSEEEMLALTTHQPSTLDHELMINQMIAASLNFDQKLFEEIMAAALSQMPLEVFIIQLAYTFMEKVGLLWITNHIIPAQEHFSSHLILKQLIVGISQLQTVAKEKNTRFLLFTPVGEEHELSLLLAQYLLKKQGHTVVVMGKNTSIESLQYYCERRPVTHLYVHLITNFTAYTAEDYVQQLIRIFPQKTIVAAGPAFKQIQQVSEKLVVLKSVKEMISYTQEG